MGHAGVLGSLQRGSNGFTGIEPIGHGQRRCTSSPARYCVLGARSRTCSNKLGRIQTYVLRCARCSVPVRVPGGHDAPLHDLELPAFILTTHKGRTRTCSTEIKPRVAVSPPHVPEFNALCPLLCLRPPQRESDARQHHKYGPGRHDPASPGYKLGLFVELRIRVRSKLESNQLL